MHALQIAVRLVAGTGDEVIVATPAWPNFAGAIGVSGAKVIECAAAFRDGEPVHGRWTARPVARPRRGPSRRAVAPSIVNSPANPTGWTATLDDLEAHAGASPGIARSVDHRRRDLRPLLRRRRAGSVLPRRDAVGRPRALRPDPFQELGHDGLARRLARGAARTRAVDREPRAIFDLRRAGRVAARGGGRHRGRGGCRPEPGRPGLRQPRPAGRGASGDGPAALCRAGRGLLPVLRRRGHHGTAAPWRSGWSTRRGSASPRARPSGRPARVSCGSATPAARTTSPRWRAAWRAGWSGRAGRRRGYSAAMAA